jgi:hypothetical protein
LLGKYLTQRWSGLEWDRQQKYMRDDRILQKRYEVLEHLTKSVASTSTSIDDILTMYRWEWGSRRDVSRIRDRQTFWAESSRDWRTESKLLRTQLRLYFRSTEASELFENVIRFRREAGNVITNLLQRRTDPKPGSEVAKRNAADIAAASKLNEKMLESLAAVAEALKAQIPES